MVAQLSFDVLGTPPVDRFVLIRKSLEKMEWLLDATPRPLPAAAALPAAAGYTWAPTVVDTETAHTLHAASRLGLYNAGFLSTTSDGGTFSPPVDNRNRWFRYMTLEAPFLAVDGECYYGTPWPSKGRLLVDGTNASRRMTEHRYTTFSHHNSFWPLDDEASPTPKMKSINHWQITPLDLNVVANERLPVSPAYLRSARDHSVSVYDYIRDHLGYRLEIAAVDVTIDLGTGAAGNSSASVAVSLTNYGFSAPINTRDLKVVLVATRSNTVAWVGTAATAVDWRKWQPTTPGDPDRVPLVHSFTARGAADRIVSGEVYSIGVSLRDPVEAGCSAWNAVAFANEGVTRFVQPPGEHQTGGSYGCFDGTSLVGAIQMQ